MKTCFDCARFVSTLLDNLPDGHGNCCWEPPRLEEEGSHGIVEWKTARAAVKASAPACRVFVTRKMGE